MNLMLLLGLTLSAVLVALLTLWLVGMIKTVLLPDLKYIIPVILVAVTVGFLVRYVSKEKDDEAMVKSAVLHNYPLPKQYDELVDKYEYHLTKEMQPRDTSIVKVNVIHVDK